MLRIASKFGFLSFPKNENGFELHCTNLKVIYNKLQSIYCLVSSTSRAERINKVEELIKVYMHLFVDFSSNNNEESFPHTISTLVIVILCFCPNMR